MTLKQLEKKMQAVEKQLAKLATVERRVAKLEKSKVRPVRRTPKARRKARSTHSVSPNGAPLTEAEKIKRFEEQLRKDGLLVELPPEAKKLAAEWRARPEQERKRILQEFAELPLDKPLSEIVLENRR